MYIRPVEYYLKLEKTRDVLEYPISDLLDISGWDLKKALQLLHGANPTLFEWCASLIVYLETPFLSVFRRMIPGYFSPQKSLYHYVSMAEGNYRDYLRGETVRAKKYFYVLRPILACRWILEQAAPPPILFADLVESQLPDDLREDVKRLLELKIHSPEIRMIPRIDRLNAYLDGSIAEIRQILVQRSAGEPKAWEELNGVFRDALREYG